MRIIAFVLVRTDKIVHQLSGGNANDNSKESNKLLHPHHSIVCNTLVLNQWLHNCCDVPHSTKLRMAQESVGRTMVATLRGILCVLLPTPVGLD